MADSRLRPPGPTQAAAARLLDAGAPGTRRRGGGGRGGRHSGAGLVYLAPAHDHIIRLTSRIRPGPASEPGPHPNTPSVAVPGRGPGATRSPPAPSGDS